jgi:hypothetical protein
MLITREQFQIASKHALNRENSDQPVSMTISKVRVDMWRHLAANTTSGL